MKWPKPVIRMMRQAKVTEIANGHDMGRAFGFAIGSAFSEGFRSQCLHCSRTITVYVNVRDTSSTRISVFGGSDVGLCASRAQDRKSPTPPVPPPPAPELPKEYERFLDL